VGKLARHFHISSLLPYVIYSGYEVGGSGGEENAFTGIRARASNGRDGWDGLLLVQRRFAKYTSI